MPFRDILKELVDGVPGAWGAIFVDWEGESVDLYATRDKYEVKLAGAHAGLLLNRVVAAGKESGLGRTRSAMIRAEDANLFLHMIDEEYFVLLATAPGPNAAVAAHRLAVAVKRLRKFV